ncbi:MAG TPA: hypothetical protein DER09_09605 [Prolixibacteraceae bacterium]|nr:hypothetical protein [Prolixibacteraceae bacterium]
MKTFVITTLLIPCAALMFFTVESGAQPTDSTAGNNSHWYLSTQFLGLTYHPGGGTTPGIYPLKLDKEAYLDLEIGLVANIDYSFGKYAFLRFSSALYKDCAFVTAGSIHMGPRFQYSWKKNSVNIGIGPIFSFREDWHQFPEYQGDEFYGDRVHGRWQYRFFPAAVELEYLRKINDHIEFQYSLIPGAPLVITSLFGVRFNL